MKTVKEIREMIEIGFAFGTDRVSPGIAGAICLALLDHIDRLNGRSDIMAEVAEGHMVIMRTEDVVPIDIHQKLRRDFVSISRELLALEQAVDECNKGIITKTVIRIRQKMILGQDDEYQRAIRPDLEAALRRAKESAWTPQFAAKTDISAGDPIVDLNSYDIPDQYDRMDFRELTEAIIARGGLYVPAEDTLSQTQEMREWLRHADSVGFNTESRLVIDRNNYDCMGKTAKPHAFILDTTSGLTHTEYRVCKCGLSEFNLMHTREDTNAKTNQDSSQT